MNAFDKIEHEAILQILAHRGFGDKWLSWIKSILTSRTSLVLINGVPRKTFYYRRRVRLGDPLSPVLFVLAANLLQWIVSKGSQLGFLNLPIHVPSSDFLIIQYADDTWSILEASIRQPFFLLKEILQSFIDSIGLKINFSKSMLVQVNVNNEKLPYHAKAFGYATGSFPFTYLGLPLVLSRP